MQKFNACRLVLLAAIGVCTLFSGGAIAGDDSRSHRFSPVDWIGKTYANLAAEWWLYHSDLPPGINPSTLPPGPIDCKANQRGRVWFIPSPAGFQPLEFSCTIKRRALFFPLISQILFNDPNFPPGLSLAEKRQFLDFNEQFLCGRAFLNGEQTSRAYPTVYIQSKAFTYESGADGMMDIFGYLPGEVLDTETVASGYFVLLPPLPHGEHTLRIVGGLGCTLEDGEPEILIVDNTYHLTVAGFGRRNSNKDDD